VATSQNASLSPEWVKWVAGIALMLNAAVFGYAISIEHRVTKTEENLTAHLDKAKDDKKEINERLKAQDDNISKVLTGITTVQVDVAEIKGYMQRAKSKD
jgi:hypothetical protein